MVCVSVFAGAVIMKGKRTLKWSSLRKDLRQEVICVRMKVLQNTVPGLPDPNSASSEELTAVVLNMYPLDEILIAWQCARQCVRQ